MKKPVRRSIVRRSESQPVRCDAPGIKAKPVRLSPSMSAEEARRVTMLECFAQIAANIPAIRAREMQGVHQARVGLRRLDVALKAFRRTLPERDAEKLQAHGEALTDLLGQARDLDVFVTELITPAADAAENKQAVSLLAKQAEALRRAAWDKAVVEVEKPALGDFLDRIAALAQGSHASESGDEKHGGSLQVEEIAGQALDKFLAKARQRGDKIASDDERDFHRLRIALKKLRYATEFFQHLYKKDRAKPYLKAMKATLDLLGALHDITAARETLKMLSKKAKSAPDAKAQMNYATGLVLGWHSARAERMAKQIHKCWDALLQTKPFWH